jgi:MFS family permease
MASFPPGGQSGIRIWNRELATYPERDARRMHLLLVVLITVTLYYELYVGSGVATIMLSQLKMPFPIFVYILAAGNLLGAFASLLAGLADRFGRGVVSFVEGIILVATPALIRDFAPQVGRATAMGFWTIGPVLGSLTVSAVNTLTLPTYQTWQSQFVICGVAGLVVFALAFLFLRELAPALRDQLMVSERDRVLVELKAKGLDIEASLRNPWRQMMHVDVIASALGVSVMLLAYYTAVGFGLIYLVTVFQFSVAQANALANWTWGANALALIVAGVISDRLRVRKPFMLAGGGGGAIMLWLYLLQAGQHPSFATLVVISCVQTLFMGCAYVTWMASFTETVEAHNPALTATGLAIWGWLVRLVVTACFLCLPAVVKSVTPLIEAPYYIAAYQQTLANHATPPAPLLEALGAIKAAAAAAPGEWQEWYWICIGGIAVFIATIFFMRGRWSPAAARADEAAHDAAVARELHALQAR